MKRSIIFAGLLAAFLALWLTGCRKEEKKEADGKPAYTVYYTNAEGSRLNGVSYTPQESTFEGILNELLEQFKTTDEAQQRYSLVPPTVSIEGYSIGVDSLAVDFSGTYIGLDSTREILLRTGIVRTMIQLPGIYTVSITVDGQPLTEPGSGHVVGPMREESFIDAQGESISSYSLVEIPLYFPDRTDNQLVGEDRNAFCSSGMSLERVITEQLLKGPETPGYRAVAVTGVEINSVKIEDGICVIDLNDSFNQTSEDLADPELCLYAFAETICESCEAESVSFRINGMSDVLFRGEVSLERTFAPDPSLLPGEEEAET